MQSKIPGKRRKLSEGNDATTDGHVTSDVQPDYSMDSVDIDQWTPQQVCGYLTAKGFENEAQLFLKQEISGKYVLDKLMTEELLEQKLHIRSLGRRRDILKEFETLKKRCDDLNPKVDQGSYKVFNDPIHGHIEVHPLCIQIIDTIQFQRLRYIKQLGCSYLVFPGAAHNRFEHSLGVCHLAGMLCRALKERQPELNITEKDVLCVQIAGLCHDLGHGPFSHVFDKLFIPAVLPNKSWAHEQASTDMFDYLIESNQLMGAFGKFGLVDKDVYFIKEQIAGRELDRKKPWPYQGRPEDKSFLYEIVANKLNEIDVDKWDYFLRDCHNLGISSSFDCHRFMKFCRVIQVDGKKQICSRDKEAENLYDMFYTRNRLHRRAYQHKVTKIIESMIVEALVKANDHLLFKGKNGQMLKMSAAIDDMVAYAQITDDVILQIMRSDNPALAESRNILEMVQTRQLYKCIGQIQPPVGTPIKRDSVPVMKDEIIKCQNELGLEGPRLTADQLVIHIVDLNYGMGEQNPVDNVRFYSKENPEQAIVVRKSQVSHMLPECFAEQHIRVHCKVRDPDSVSNAHRCFKAWCDKKDYSVLEAGNILDSELMTPYRPTTKTTMTTTKRPQDDDHTPEKKKSRTSLFQGKHSVTQGPL